MYVLKTGSVSDETFPGEMEIESCALERRDVEAGFDGSRLWRKLLNFDRRWSSRDGDMPSCYRLYKKNTHSTSARRHSCD